MRAEEWDRRAMEAGSLAALLNFGRYSWDRGDWDACERIIGVGSAMGWAPAQCRLALARLERSRTKSTFVEVRPLLEAAASKGSPRALNNLSLYLIKGYAGLAGILQGLRIVPRLACQGDVRPRCPEAGCRSAVWRASSRPPEFLLCSIARATSRPCPWSPTTARPPRADAARSRTRPAASRARCARRSTTAGPSSTRRRRS